MKRTHRHHSPEFKREAVALVQEQGYRYAAAGRRLGVSGALIGRWKGRIEEPRDGRLSWPWTAHSRATAHP